MESIRGFLKGAPGQHLIGGTVVAAGASLILYGFAMFVTWGAPFVEWPTSGRLIYGAVEIVILGTIAGGTLEMYFDNRD